MKKYSIALAALLTVVNIFAGGTVNAQNSDNNQEPAGNGLRISPVRFDAQIRPGQSDEVRVRVENVTAGKLTASGVVNDFVAAEDESGIPAVAFENSEEIPPYSIRGFVGELGKYELEPGDSVEVPVRFDIPTDASPGAYYGVVRFIANDGQNIEQGNVGLTASVGTVVLIEVPGDIVESVELETIEVTKEGKGGTLFQSAPDEVSIRLSNKGNSFAQPFGKVRILDWRGNLVKEYELNPSDPKANVLPGSIRNFKESMPEIGIGRYKVEANISYGEGGGNIISASVGFWYLPLWLILIVVIGLPALVAAGAFSLRRYNKMVIKKSKSKK